MEDTTIKTATGASSGIGRAVANRIALGVAVAVQCAGAAGTNQFATAGGTNNSPYSVLACGLAPAAGNEPNNLVGSVELLNVLRTDEDIVLQRWEDDGGRVVV